jgi:hypothetical protein
MESSGWHFMDEKQVNGFIDNIKKIFEIIAERQNI